MHMSGLTDNTLEKPPPFDLKYLLWLDWMENPNHYPQFTNKINII